MPRITVTTEPFSAPPKPNTTSNSNRTSSATPWDGPLELDRGWAELTDAAISPSSDTEALDACEELILNRCTLEDLSVVSSDLLIEATDCLLSTCNLGPVRFRSLRKSTLRGCRLGGTDFGTAHLDDVTFENCSLRYANLRLAKLTRVRFLNCTFDDVDASEAAMTDVAFPGSTLRDFTIDRVRAQRVDLREAKELGLTRVRNLDGFLVSEGQLPALVWTMAAALDLGVEQQN